MNNYSVMSSYGRKTCGGGGVMILSRDNAQVKKVTLPEMSKLCLDKEFECCAVKCNFIGSSFVLLGIYRTPGIVYDNIFLDKLDIALTLLNQRYKQVILAGDININVLNPSSRTFLRLSNILTQHKMQYLVNFPTRVTVDCKSAIDNIITNLPKTSLSIIGLITELSDHDVQLLKKCDMQCNVVRCIQC